MHLASPAPCCAPYSVFSGSRLVGVVSNLVDLYEVLAQERSNFEKERAQLTAKRAAAAAPFIFTRPLPDPPVLSVVDARGSERPEFNSHWGVLWFFGCQRYNLATVVDYGWDGDHRPRGTPIPGTGRRGSYGQRYYRRPQTQSQRRSSFPLTEEGEPEFRGARKVRSLPSFWDDVPRRSWRDRNWKAFRTTQWKPHGDANV